MRTLTIRTVKLWEAGSGKELAMLKGHTAGVTSVAYSPDEKTLASGSEDDTVKLWETGSGRELATLKGHTHVGGKLVVETLKGRLDGVTSVAYSPDGTTLASGGRKDTVKLWEAGSGKELATLKGYATDLLSVAYSPDGKTLVSGNYDEKAKSGIIRLWRAATDEEVARQRNR